jgi:steroid 5-alpha reductase family enzyme
MRIFRNNINNKGKTMKYKLWKYSRHPNYLGEIGFWFGIYFMGISSGLSPYWLIVCPLTMLALFIFVSCPMMDNRSLINRSDYKDYMKKTSQLLLLPPKT